MEYRSDLFRRWTHAIEFVHHHIPMDIADAFERDLTTGAVNLVNADHPQPGIDDRKLLPRL